MLNLASLSFDPLADLDLTIASSSAIRLPRFGRLAYKSLARSRIFESSAQSLNSVGIFLLQGFLLLLQPLQSSHVFYHGSHRSNLKLLKISGLTNAYITKVREVTKVSNVFATYGWISKAMQS